MEDRWQMEEMRRQGLLGRDPGPKKEWVNLLVLPLGFGFRIALQRRAGKVKERPEMLSEKEVKTLLANLG